jgi:hypothetical protein
LDLDASLLRLALAVVLERPRIVVTAVVVAVASRGGAVHRLVMMILRVVGPVSGAGARAAAAAAVRMDHAAIVSVVV